MEFESIGSGCSWVGACRTRLPAGHRLGQEYPLRLLFTVHFCLVCWLLDSWPGVHIVDATLSLCRAPIYSEALTQQSSQQSDLRQSYPLPITKTRHPSISLGKGFVPKEPSVHSGTMPAGCMSCVPCLGQGVGTARTTARLSLYQLPAAAQIELEADCQL